MLLGVSLTFYLTDGLPERLPEESRESYELLTSQRWVWSVNEECLQQYEFPAADDFPWWFCYLEETTPPDVGLLGSSRMNQLMAGFESNPRLAPLNVLSIGTCGMLMDRELVVNYGGPNPCELEPRNLQFDFFQRTFEPSPLPLVLVEAATFTDLGVYDSGRSVNDAALERLEEVRAIADSIVVVAPWMIPRISPEDCLVRPVRLGVLGDCEVPRDVWRSQEQEWLELRSEISGHFPEVKFFDPNPAFCDAEKCYFVLDGLPVMRDRSHLSVYGSELVAKLFVEWANENQVL